MTSFTNDMKNALDKSPDIRINVTNSSRFLATPEGNLEGQFFAAIAAR